MKRGDGQVVLITGGASGIGRAFGDELARLGFEVVLADRQIELAEEGATAICERGGKATAAELDVRDAAAFAELAAATVKRSGRIDYLFNNAGIGVAGEMDSFSVADWDDVFDVNLRGVAYGIRAVYPVMIQQRSGHIVNTSSVAGLLPATNEGSYTAAKHGVVGLSKALRIEAKRHGVRVSALCPGVILTPILTGGRYSRWTYPNLSVDRVMELWERFRPMNVDVFARRALAAVFRNEAIIVIPRWWKALWYLDRLSPTMSMMLFKAMHERLRKELAERSG